MATDALAALKGSSNRRDESRLCGRPALATAQPIPQLLRGLDPDYFELTAMSSRSLGLPFQVIPYEGGLNYRYDCRHEMSAAQCTRPKTGDQEEGHPLLWKTGGARRSAAS